MKDKTIMGIAFMLLITIIAVILFSNHQAEADRAFILQQKELRARNQINCVDIAEKRANQRFINECVSQYGIPDCRLPLANYDRIQKQYVSDKITCQEAFK